MSSFPVMKNNDTISVTVPVTPSVFSDDADQDGSSFIIDKRCNKHYILDSEPAAPLLACIIPAGVFFTGVRMEYCKPPRSISEQLKLLSDRGMIIDNPSEAEKFLLHVKLYEFDDKLRTILFDYIGHFEIAFRSLFCYEASIFLDDSHWHMKKKHFDNRFDFHEFISGCHSEIKRSSEIFIKSYYDKYEKPILPANWMLTEILSLGRWSKMYASFVHGEVKKKVAERFGISSFYLESWVKGLTELRNHCAHHNRIWNRQFTSALTLFKSKKDRIDNRKLAGYVFVMNELLTPLGKQKDFNREIQNLFHNYQEIPKEPMGCNTAFCKEMGLIDE